MKEYGKKILLLVTILLAFILLGTRSVLLAQQSCESTCDPNDQKCLTNLTNLCQEQVSQLQSQAKTLKNQIAQFDAQIRLTTLKINQTKNQIDLLSGRIDQLEISLIELTKAFSSRAVETYKLSKFESNFFFILRATDISDATQRFYYLRKIQEEDRSLLNKLESAQTTYQGEKVDQETLQKQLAAQQASLNSQKTVKNNLLTVTKNNESKYQSLLAAANAQLDKFRNFAASRGGSSILSSQTKCNDGWSGCYYNQRDSEWGNAYLGGTSYKMKDSGCFVTSVAMLASYNGKNIKPGEIASLPAVFTSQGDLRWEPFSVNGTTVSINSDSKSNLDSYLSSGKPVIAKLSYSYGDHFIVILRKDGDNYIMNDPYMENGYNKKLGDGGYSYSDIVSLRTVSFN
jgi:peptidoglycan hydrolase CwlO-like protein